MSAFRTPLLAFLALAAIFVLLLGCSDTESAQTESSERGPSATASVPAANAVTLKLISFNLYYGAGYERRFDEHVSPRFRGVNRMPELVSFLREADPDVLAVQEAAGWDIGDPSQAEEVARELGMSYVLAPDAWELHVVLFSKYPIVDAAYVSRFQDFNGVALRATLAVAPEQHVNVMAVHLNSMSRETRACQVDALLDMAGELEGRTILLGDMNFRANSPQGAVLREEGWQLVAAQEQWPIDQIWLDDSGAFSADGWWAGVRQPPRISDHFPVGAGITFEVPPSSDNANSPPVTEPAVLDYACPIVE